MGKPSSKPCLCSLCMAQLRPSPYWRSVPTRPTRQRSPDERPELSRNVVLRIYRRCLASIRRRFKNTPVSFPRAVGSGVARLQEYSEWKAFGGWRRKAKFPEASVLGREHRTRKVDKTLYYCPSKIADLPTDHANLFLEFLQALHIAKWSDLLEPTALALHF